MVNFIGTKRKIPSTIDRFTRRIILRRVKPSVNHRGNSKTIGIVHQLGLEDIEGISERLNNGYRKQTLEGIYIPPFN